MYRCSKCGQPWDDDRARDNDLICTRRCGGHLAPIAPLVLPDLEGCDLGRLPYPVALTASRLTVALRASGDVLKTLFLLKDCFEATIKYLGAILLADYRRSSACTPGHTEVLLKSMVRPSLGAWVSDVVRPLSLWLIGEAGPGSTVAALFADLATKPGSKPAESALMQRCKQFVTYRNDALGHGAQRHDSVYEKDLAGWLPLIRRLLDGVASLAPWRLCLVTAEDRCQVWVGPEPGAATEPGCFSAKGIGHFVLRGASGEYRDLYPFVCYLPDTQQANRLHYYDSLYRYQATKKAATVLEYDNGERHSRPEPATGLEEAFTAELLAQAFKWHRGRMEIIEGRVANFGELIEAHAAIVGRRFVVDHVHKFITENDRGLLVIEAQPGKGKTAIMAHLIEEVFGQHAPQPVHFFYRRTAGITDPDVCVRSLYHALLEAHGITEAEESKQRNSPEEVWIKLTNLLGQEIAPRLLPGRPQVIFIDALDEASGNAFQRIPESLPAGVYIIATTRPVSDRIALARRHNLHWYDLDSPDLLQENLRDSFEYVQRELTGTELLNETLDEIARIGVGNFLVLKLLCQHLRSTLPPDQVAAFLSRLATDGGKDQLGFIYAEFWQRLTERCTREDVNLLCDVAGLLVTAHAPLTADLVCGVLGLRAGDWDVALRRLAEYLTIVENEEDGVRATFYRVYHESFADFLRVQASVDQHRLRRLLADYCLQWSRHPEAYVLRFAPTHLWEVSRWNELVKLLCHERFLKQRIKRNLIFELFDDYRSALTQIPAAHPGRAKVQQMDEMLQRSHREALERLPMPSREVLTLRYALDYTPEQLAELLSVNVADVDHRLSSARLRLSRRLLAILSKEVWHRGSRKDDAGP
jgi:DNA-directed RNA polymerase specialized sigma24 family protein